MNKVYYLFFFGPYHHGLRQYFRLFFYPIELFYKGEEISAFKRTISV